MSTTDTRHGWKSLSVSEALAAAATVKKSVAMDHMQVLRGTFELVQLADVPADTLGRISTRQSHGFPLVDRVAIKTEYRTAIPVAHEMNQAPEEKKAEMAVAITFSVGFTYDFSQNTHAAESTMIAFSKIQAINHSWPFWREFAYSSLARMQVAANITPLLPAEQAAAMAGFVTTPLQAKPKSAAIIQAPATTIKKKNRSRVSKS